MQDQTSQSGHRCDHMPHVMTASFQQDGENLIATLDGDELVVPGGSVSSSIEDDGKITVHLYATFRADAVDLISEEAGS